MVLVGEKTDQVVVVVGDSIAQNGETRDRADLNLTPDQIELLKTVKSKGKKLIVVLIAGKLTISCPKSALQQPFHYNQPPTLAQRRLRGYGRRTAVGVRLRPSPHDIRLQQSEARP